MSFLLHPGAPTDVELWDIRVQELKRRRIVRKGDLVVADKGDFKCLQYQNGIAQYQIVPGLFPRRNTPVEKILAQLTYPLRCYGPGRSARERVLYQRLKAALRHFLTHWNAYRPIRSRIEDFIKAGKEAFGWGVMHRYTWSSTAKHLALGGTFDGARAELRLSGKAGPAAAGRVVRSRSP